MKTFWISLTVFLVAVGGAGADTSEILVPPTMNDRFTAQFGANSLRDAFVNAGVPLRDTDAFEYDPKTSVLTVSGSRSAIRFIWTLMDEFSGERSIQKASDAIERHLAGKVASLAEVEIHGIDPPSSIRFEPDHQAVGLDANGRAAENYRWAVTNSGEVQIRKEDGRLLLKCHVDAIGRLIFTLSKDSTSYEITLVPEP
ncbi:MAG: hypothetical protein AAF591_22810 [Verrucomicrobiota bacterium]